MPRFSIAIPAYKAKFLKECIDSILAQDFKDYELIILNDASPEGIEEIVQAYDDTRIKYFRNEENVGAYNVVNNWNKLLELAQGELLICMGDDDRLMPNCLSVYDALEKKYPKLDIYHGWTEIINESSEVTSLQEPRPECESVYSMIWQRWKGRIQFVGDFCYRTSSLRATGGFYFLPMAWASDDITAFQVCGNKGIANTQIPVFQYRVSSMTISRNLNTMAKMEAIGGEQQWYDNFLKIMPSDPIDAVIYKCIYNDKDKNFKIKRRWIVARDIAEHPFTRTLFWLFNGRKYDLTIKDVLYSTFIVLKT